MLKLKPDLFNLAKFTAIPSAAGRPYDMTTLCEDSHAAIVLILANTTRCAYTKGQAEQIKTHKWHYYTFKLWNGNYPSTGGLTGINTIVSNKSDHITWSKESSFPQKPA